MFSTGCQHLFSFVPAGSPLSLIPDEQRGATIQAAAGDVNNLFLGDDVLFIFYLKSLVNEEFYVCFRLVSCRIMVQLTYLHRL
jgi:hypothetical protein